MWQKIGGRKFFVAMSSIISCSLLTYFGYIHEGVYSAVMLGTIGAYIAGNVTQKVATPTTK